MEDKRFDMVCTNECIHEFTVCEYFVDFWQWNVFIWQSQFLGRLIRSAGVPEERGSGILKENETTNFFFPPLHSLVLIT